MCSQAGISTLDVLPDGLPSGADMQLAAGESEVVGSWALHMHDASGKGPVKYHALLRVRNCLDQRCKISSLTAAMWPCREEICQGEALRDADRALSQSDHDSG